MNHSFNTQIAFEYGIVEALLLERFYFWIEKNIANEKHFHDGYYWTYTSVKALNEIYDYVTPSKLGRAIKHLETEGLLLKGNYNKSAYDRTCWYAPTEKAYDVLGVKTPFFILQNGNCTVPNGNQQNDEPIPVIKTVIETVNFSQSEEKNQNCEMAATKTQVFDDSENDADKSANVNNQENDFDIENAYMQILKLYPRTSTKGAGFEVWKKLMVSTPKNLRLELARKIYDGILEYLKNHLEENPNDTSYLKVKEIEWWMKNDMDYWVKWIERKERLKEDE